MKPEPQSKTQEEILRCLVRYGTDRARGGAETRTMLALERRGLAKFYLAPSFYVATDSDEALREEKT
jgi:hypothetical protein